MKTYAGIGARRTPWQVLNTMTGLATELETYGYHLRTGGAIGADAAFEAGVIMEHNRTIYRPENASAKAYFVAKAYHPKWNNLNDIGKAFHARNCEIMLGKNLNEPVDFVICWTDDGRIVGGTGQSLRIAKAYDIKVFNLFSDPSGLEVMNGLL